MKKTTDWGSTLAILLLATQMNEGYLKKYGEQWWRS